MDQVWSQADSLDSHNGQIEDTRIKISIGGGIMDLILIYVVVES